MGQQQLLTLAEKGTSLILKWLGMIEIILRRSKTKWCVHMRPMPNSFTSTPCPVWKKNDDPENTISTV